MTRGTMNRAIGATMLLAVCGLAFSVAGGWDDSPAGAGLDPTRAAPGDGAPARPSKDDSSDDSDKKFKPFAEVSKGFEKVISTTDGKSFYTLWKKEKDGSLLAELPRGFEGQKHFVALTVASGEEYAGLQQGDMLVYWRRFDDRMVLLEPNLETKSTGDAESKSSVQRLFTDRVILDIPIVTMGPGGGPVIDMKDLLANRAPQFFGGSASGAQPRLAQLKSAKAFPENIEIGYELPTSGGRLKEFHYSISLMRGTQGYKPRNADTRIGYFTTTYRDLGKFTDKEKWVRYINRWSLEKRDPNLRLSPPKQPIVFYLEETVPVRYRRWVRDGVLEWNKAFEKVGILDAIRVEQQDAETNQHMDKDPEDVRYNFVRWLSNDQGTAIGPSRVNPNTGEILDADIILTDGWIRHFWVQFNEVMPELAMEGFTPETMSWLDKNPQWDPRVRLADPAKRDSILAQRARRGVLAYGGHPIATSDSPDGETNVFDGLLGRQSQYNSLCMAANGKALDMSTFRMMMELWGDELSSIDPDDGAKSDDKKDEKKDDTKDKPPTLDGIPEWFIGPMLRDLVMHEVGHTMGLRHNFKASAIYDLAEINSDKIKGKKAFAGSVMDYMGANLSVKDGKLLGDITMIDLGPYDYWAIEYGYTSGDTKKVLERVAEPELIYGTDEDTSGPDPYARRYDFAKNPLDYAKMQVDLAKYHRSRLLDKFVKDGDSWAKARKGYELTLSLQTRSLSMMANWLGGVHVNRDNKGDPNARPPLEVVPVDQQRDALRWVIDNAFFDEAFGLTPELLVKMTTDKWLDWGGASEAVQDSTWPVHDRVGGIQSSVLTMIMNPTTLRRIYDNELRLPSDQDALTLAETMDSTYNAIWTEIERSPSERYTARRPMISSLRRGLQQEYVERLIDLTMDNGVRNEAFKPVCDLAMTQLRKINSKIDNLIDKNGKNSSIDAYSEAHLSELRTRITKALDAQYIYNAGDMGGMGSLFHMFGQSAARPEHGPIEPDYMNRSR